MTAGGWFMMLVSVCSVTTLFVICLYKVLTGGPAPEHLHGLDIDTKDTHQE